MLLQKAEFSSFWLNNIPLYISPHFPFKISFFYLEGNYFTILWCFCHISMWISRRDSRVPPSWTPLPPPSLPYPSGLSQSPGFGCPASCMELNTGHVFYIWYCTCFNASLSNHPNHSSHWVRVCSFHLCLLCCPACRVIGTIFLNSIYMR